MQFRAVLPNVSLSPEEWLYPRDIQCPVCYALFRLWAPVIWTEQTDVAIHADWLTQHLMARTLGHPIQALRNTELTGLKKRVPRPSRKLKMQDSAGPAREAFVQERTDVYYAELLLKRVG